MGKQLNRGWFFPASRPSSPLFRNHTHHRVVDTTWRASRCVSRRVGRFISNMRHENRHGDELTRRCWKCETFNFDDYKLTGAPDRSSCCRAACNYKVTQGRPDHRDNNIPLDLQLLPAWHCNYGPLLKCTVLFLRASEIRADRQSCSRYVRYDIAVFRTTIPLNSPCNYRWIFYSVTQNS